MELGQILLTRLEEYQARLANPNNSLKDVEVSLTLLEQENKLISPVLDKLDISDPLSEILQAISATAAVEAIKFRRGEYL
jgi:hypothetical protein